MIEILEWLESTDLAAIARESLYGFQILVAAHLIGLIFSVGTLLWMDLRMIGLGLPDQSLTSLYGRLSRWFGAGFSLMFLSGFALFAGFATSAIGNTYFRIKLLAIGLAGINAVMFHILLKRVPSDVNSAATPPASIRLAGVVSVCLWTVVILCGRLISYTLF